MVDELEVDEVGLDELVVDEVKNRPSGCRRGARLPCLFVFLNWEPSAEIKEDNFTRIDRFTNIFKFYACIFNKGCS